jgi:integrase
MSKKEALYPHLKNGLVKARGRISGSNIYQPNKKLILDFMVKLEADGTGKPQLLSYMNRIRPIAVLIGNKNFKKVTKKDMEGVYAKYRRDGYTVKRNGTEEHHSFSQSSLNKTVECLKAFYRWVFDLSSQDPAPKQVRWMKRERVPNKIRAEQLWTEDDIEKINRVVKSDRDICIINILFEAGLRPGEIRGLRIGDVKLNKDMARLYVAGKTERIGGERIIPIIRSYNCLRAWLSKHPRRDDTKAWLWTYDNKPLMDSALRIQIRRIAEKAGIAKPVNPYILRHSALTKFYKELTGTVASKLAGHAPGSREANTYCHLSPENLDDAVREMNGIPKHKKEENNQKCHRCDQTLGLGDRICPVCGLAQDSEIATKRMDDAEDAMNIMAGIKALTNKYPELGAIINGYLEKEQLHSTNNLYINCAQTTTPNI